MIHNSSIIDKNASIGKNTKIGPFCYIGPKVKIEDGIKILLNNINHWKSAPVWTKDTINKATKTWFQYLKKTIVEQSKLVRSKFFLLLFLL